MAEVNMTTKRNPAIQAEMMQQMAQSDGLQGLDIKVEAKEIAPILSGGNTTVLQKADDKTDPSGVSRTGNPLLDLPDDSKAMLADLEKLIAELTLETGEKQAQETEKRIKSLLGEMRKTQQQALEKINESIKKCEEASKAAKRNKILGWIMTAISVIACVVTCIATFGAATPLAIAACAFTVAGTALTLTNQILDATGVKEKHIEKRAQQIKEKNPQMSTAEAEAEAQKEWDLGFGIACGICAIGAITCGLCSSFTQAGKKALEAATKRLSEQALKVVQYIALSAQALGAAGGAVSTGFAWKDLSNQKKLTELQAQVKEVMRLLDHIEELLEEEEDRLKELLVQINDAMAALTSILEAPIAESKRIAEAFMSAV